MAEDDNLTEAQKELLDLARKTKGPQIRKLLEGIAKDPETAKHVLQGYKRGQAETRRRRRQNKPAGPR